MAKNEQDYKDQKRNGGIPLPQSPLGKERAAEIKPMPQGFAPE